MAYRICKVFCQAYMAERIVSTKVLKCFLWNHHHYQKHNKKQHHLLIVKTMQCGFPCSFFPCRITNRRGKHWTFWRLELEKAKNFFSLLLIGVQMTPQPLPVPVLGTQTGVSVLHLAMYFHDTWRNPISSIPVTLKMIHKLLRRRGTPQADNIGFISIGDQLKSSTSVPDKMWWWFLRLNMSCLRKTDTSSFQFKRCAGAVSQSFQAELKPCCSWEPFLPPAAFPTLVLHMFLLVAALAENCTCQSSNCRVRMNWWWLPALQAILLCFKNLWVCYSFKTAVFWDYIFNFIKNKDLQFDTEGRKTAEWVTLSVFSERATGLNLSSSEHSGSVQKTTVLKGHWL